MQTLIIIPTYNEAENLRKLAAGIHFIAALATLFVGIPLLQIPPCL